MPLIFTPQTLFTDQLSDTTRQEICTICALAHNNDEFYNLFSYFPEPAKHFLSYVEDKLVSHAVVSIRWVKPEGRDILKTAYFDAVATLPKYQGRGYGRKLMNFAVENLAEYQATFLQTDIPGFYEKCGWKLWEGKLFGRKDDALVDASDQSGVMYYPMPGTGFIKNCNSLSIECQPSRVW